MSWGTKYRAEFYDTHGLEWRWDFEFTDYAGAVNTMQPSGSPGTYEPLADGDDILANPVRGTKATLRVKAMTTFQYKEFYTMDDLSVRCSIYYGAAHTLYFRGYVTAFNYAEPYNDPPYDVEISVNCGLGTLKSIYYEESDGVPYTGRKLESQVLLDILGKINVTTFTEIVNIYETRMVATTSASPIDQTYLDVSNFDDMTCYQVLEHIIHSWDALIRHRLGVFVVYRPLEMITEAYARTFTAATTKSASTITALMPLRRSTQLTAALRDVNGGKLMLLPSSKKIIITQDYGYKESWLANYKFSASTYEDYLFNSWHVVGLPGMFYPAGFSVKKEVEGVLLVNEIGTVPCVSSYIYQDVGPYAKKTSDVFEFSFEYMIVNPTSADVTDVGIWIAIESVEEDFWADQGDGANCTWETTLHYINFTVGTAEMGASAWTTKDLLLPGLPASGSYRIKLFATDQGCFVAYKNIRFNSTSDEMIVKRAFWALGYYKNKFNITIVDNAEIIGRTYEVDNAISGIEIDRPCVLGDVTDTNITNVIEQFRGSLGILLTNSLAQTALDFVTDFAADYLSADVVIWADSNMIYFEAASNTVDFSGASSITPVGASTLDGVVEVMQVKVTARTQIDTITLSGSGGSALIMIGTLGHLITWDTDLATTVASFVTDYATYWPGITVTQGTGANTNDLIFTEDVTGGGFTSPTITNKSLTLAGTVANTQTPLTTQKRRDRITLSGDAGTATIVVNTESQTATMSTLEVMDHTTTWNTRGGSEARPLIEIIGGEIGQQTSVPRVMLPLPMYDLTDTDTNPHVDVIGCFTDDLNTNDSDAVRIFAFNSGVFDMKSRHWDIDLVEITQEATVPDNVLLDDDGTPILNDDGSYIYTS